LGFLDFYGNHFDPRSCGISLRRRCYFNRTSSDASFFPPQFDPLYIEDPLQPGNNVGRNCFRVYLIQRVWSDALRALTSTLDQDDLRGRSLLDAMVTKGPAAKAEPPPGAAGAEPRKAE
jgi:DNA polymerase sigma